MPGPEGPEFNLAKLRVALDRIPDVAWSLPSRYSETRVHHGYRKVPLVRAGVRRPGADGFGFVFEDMGPVVEAWLSMLEPGGFIAPHRDEGPWWERWHVPILSAGTVTTASHARHGTVTRGDTFTPEPGFAFEMPHWLPHSLINDTDHPRVSLVIDRGVRISRPWAPFAPLPATAEIQALIERSSACRVPVRCISRCGGAPNRS